MIYVNISILSSDEGFNPKYEQLRLKAFEFIKAVSDTVFDMINAAYRDKTLIFIRAIRLSLSRLFLTLYLT